MVLLGWPVNGKASTKGSPSHAANNAVVATMTARRDNGILLVVMLEAIAVAVVSLPLAVMLRALVVVVAVDTILSPRRRTIAS